VEFFCSLVSTRFSFVNDAALVSASSNAGSGKFQFPGTKAIARERALKAQPLKKRTSSQPLKRSSSGNPLHLLSMGGLQRKGTAKRKAVSSERSKSVGANVGGSRDEEKKEENKSAPLPGECFPLSQKEVAL